MAITVLAIDDTKSVVDVIRLFLEGSGFVVKGVTNPTEGISLAQAGGIDLILLDIIMPDMDGYQVWDLLKADERTREIPVIMLTAHAILTHTPKDFLYGLYGYVAKPFSRDELIAVIGNAMRLTKADSWERLMAAARKPKT
jgi:two-component system sensor histidine kinase/response regulator